MKTAIKSNPKHFNSYVELGKVYTNMKNFKEAENNMMTALKISSNSWVYQNLGYLYTQMNKKDAAISAFEKSVELDPTNEYASDKLAKLRAL